MNAQVEELSRNPDPLRRICIDNKPITLSSRNEIYPSEDAGNFNAWRAGSYSYQSPAGGLKDA